MEYTTTASPTSSNPVLVKKKNKKIINTPQNLDTNNSIEWKSETQHQLYSAKLLRALRQVRLNNASGSNASAAPKRVREAADRVLAATAKGRSRWSRAILTNKIKLSFMKKHNIVKRQRNVMTVITMGSSRRKSKLSVMGLKSKGLPAVQRKGRVLGRLVPGCRKQPLPVVLDEATDYIAALEMQVRAMSAIADMFSGAGTSSSGGSTLNQPGSNETSPS